MSSPSPSKVRSASPSPAQAMDFLLLLQRLKVMHDRMITCLGDQQGVGHDVGMKDPDKLTSPHHPLAPLSPEVLI